MRLINTIEINPYDFSTAEYEYPDSCQIESPEERNQFWLDCISGRNLGRLKSIKEGSYLVDIGMINDDELEEILRNRLKDVDLADFEEQVGSMSGGIVLEENDVIYIEPTCCGDIGNTKEWESIFEKKPTEWNQLWIGHPWIYYKSGNGIIEFSDYTESNREDLKDVRILIKVSEAEIQIELEKIRLQQNDFEYRIKRVLDGMGLENSMQISKLMAGNL